MGLQCDDGLLENDGEAHQLLGDLSWPSEGPTQRFCSAFVPGFLRIHELRNQL